MDDLQRLLAVEEIKKLKARYFRAIDTKQWALLDEVFTDDFSCDYRGCATDPRSKVNYAPAATAVPLQGKVAAIAALRESLPAGLISAHQGYLPEIEIHDDTSASGVWAMYDALAYAPGHELHELFGYGHYYEQYQKIGSRWLIKTLRLVRTRVETLAARVFASS